MNSVNVSCDDKVVKLYNIVIVSFCPFTLIVECIVVSMFKDLLFDVC
jgi:choline-glycine betaine transporter